MMVPSSPPRSMTRGSMFWMKRNAPPRMLPRFIVHVSDLRLKVFKHHGEANQGAVHCREASFERVDAALDVFDAVVLLRCRSNSIDRVIEHGLADVDEAAEDDRPDEHDLGPLASFHLQRHPSPAFVHLARHVVLIFRTRSLGGPSGSWDAEGATKGGGLRLRLLRQIPLRELSHYVLLDQQVLYPARPIVEGLLLLLGQVVGPEIEARQQLHRCTRTRRLLAVAQLLEELVELDLLAHESADERPLHDEVDLEPVRYEPWLLRRPDVFQLEPVQHLLRHVALHRLAQRSPNRPDTVDVPAAEEVHPDARLERRLDQRRHHPDLLAERLAQAARPQHVHRTEWQVDPGQPRLTIRPLLQLHLHLTTQVLRQMVSVRPTIFGEQLRLSREATRALVQVADLAFGVLAGPRPEREDAPEKALLGGAQVVVVEQELVDLEAGVFGRVAPAAQRNVVHGARVVLDLLRQAVRLVERTPELRVS